jgi:hypothetical protein
MGAVGVRCPVIEESHGGPPFIRPIEHGMTWVTRLGTLFPWPASDHPCRLASPRSRARIRASEDRTALVSRFVVISGVRPAAAITRTRRLPRPA